MSDQSGPELLWSIKASFREYLLGIDDGFEELSTVNKNDSGEYEFRVVESAIADSTTPSTDTIAFQGELLFSAYRGILLLRFRELQIRKLTGGILEFSIMHPAYRERTTERVTIADLQLDTVEFDWETRPGYVVISGPGLTEAGVRAFGDVYQVGSQLDSFALEETFASHLLNLS